MTSRGRSASKRYAVMLEQREGDLATQKEIAILQRQLEEEHERVVHLESDNRLMLSILGEETPERWTKLATLQRQLEEAKLALVQAIQECGFDIEDRVLWSSIQTLGLKCLATIEQRDEFRNQLDTLQADNERLQQEIKRLRTTWTPPVDDLRALAQPEKEK